MPASITHDVDLPGLTVVTLTGSVSPGEIHEVRTLLYGGDRPPRAVLWDCRGLTSYPPSEGMAQMAEDAHGSGLSRANRVAVVVASEVAYGLARMGEAHAAELGGDLQIFREMDSARRWLREVLAPAVPSGPPPI